MVKKMNKFIFIIPGAILVFTLGFMALAIFESNLNIGLAFVAAANGFQEKKASISIATSSLSQIGAKSYILLAISADGVSKITEKNTEEIFYIASVSKLMTAVVALENLSLIMPISIESEDINQYSPSLLFKVGDTLNGHELVNSLLIESNNDAAEALSRQLGTTTFIALMNEKASLIGMKNTSFSNPVGTDPATDNEIGNKSTAEDLLLLVRYVLKNRPQIFAITRNINRPIMDFAGNLHHLSSSTNQLLRDDTFPYIILGGKTGHTPLASKNLVLIYRDPNLSNTIFVSIVLKSNDQFRDSLILADALRIKD